MSELVANAVVHATSEPRVLVHVRPNDIHIESADDSSELPTMRTPDADDVSGRGVSILGTLSDRWGARRRSGGGKTVWFDIVRANGGLIPQRP